MTTAWEKIIQKQKEIELTRDTEGVTCEKGALKRVVETIQTETFGEAFRSLI